MLKEDVILIAQSLQGKMRTTNQEIILKKLDLFDTSNSILKNISDERWKDQIIYCFTYLVINLFTYLLM